MATTPRTTAGTTGAAFDEGTVLQCRVSLARATKCVERSRDDRQENAPNAMACKQIRSKDEARICRNAPRGAFPGGGRDLSAAAVVEGRAEDWGKEITGT